jgi:hypothetical protein
MHVQTHVRVQCVNKGDIFLTGGYPLACHSAIPAGAGRRSREGSHIDPDGNLIRFGSPMPG